MSEPMGMAMIVVAAAAAAESGCPLNRNYKQNDDGY